MERREFEHLGRIQLASDRLQRAIACLDGVLEHAASGHIDAHGVRFCLDAIHEAEVALHPVVRRELPVAEDGAR